MKPIIGIVSKTCIESDMWHYMEIVDEIRYVLVKNQALAVGILPSELRLDFKQDEEVDTRALTETEKHDLGYILDRLDGVVLEGGLVSSQYEEEIAKICVERDLPLLGICSGFNNLIRALGGAVHIDSNTFHNQFGAKLAHEVEIDPDSKLFQILQQTKLNVNSIHTCVAHADEIKSLRVVAQCPLDQTVEAVELPDKNFIMGIKWHPELMESMNPIFAAFVKACSTNSNYKKGNYEKF